MIELCRLTATEVVSLLRRGEIKPMELVEASIERIQSVDGTVNALTDGLYLLDFGFLGGPAPKPPFPQCGVDPTSDLLPETRC